MALLYTPSPSERSLIVFRDFPEYATVLSRLRTGEITPSEAKEKINYLNHEGFFEDGRINVYTSLQKSSQEIETKINQHIRCSVYDRMIRAGFKYALLNTVGVCGLLMLAGNQENPASKNLIALGTMGLFMAGFMAFSRSLVRNYLYNPINKQTQRQADYISRLIAQDFKKTIKQYQRPHTQSLVNHMRRKICFWQK